MISPARGRVRPQAFLHQRVQRPDAGPDLGQHAPLTSRGPFGSRGATRAVGAAVPPTILIVDDEESILFALGEYFRSCGYRADCARELDEADTLLSSNPYSAVIADLRLSESHGTEGLEIAERVRARYPDTRVIILTAYRRPGIEREARRRGADVLLHKPVRLPALARIVIELLCGPGAAHEEPRHSGEVGERHEAAARSGSGQNSRPPAMGTGPACVPSRFPDPDTAEPEKTRLKVPTCVPSTGSTDTPENELPCRDPIP
jgi:CheY-like chemotaxis protein